MVPTSGFVILVLVLLISHYTYRKWKSNSAFKSAVKQYGCQNPPKYPHKDFMQMGRDLLRERVKAYQDGRGQLVYAQHFEAYGKTFEEKSYGRQVISTMEAANLQHVGALGFHDFVKGEKGRKGATAELIGPGILTSSGAEWKRSRDLIKPIFSRGEIADSKIIGRHVDRFLGIIPRDGSTFNVLPFIQKLFLDASSEFLLGESLDALSVDPPAETTAFLETFDKALHGYSRWRAAPWLYYFMYRFDTSYRISCEKLHSFIDRHVYRALSETSASYHPADSIEKVSDDTVKLGDSLQRYILVNELAKQIHDPTKLRAELMNIFLVARDNVAALTGNALFYLARHPTVWEALRKVVLSEVGAQPLTFELLKSLTLLKHVFQETLRVQGPTPYCVRTATKNTILPTGGGPKGTSPVFVEAGTAVHLNIWSLNHDKDIWGEDAYEFKPERWSSDSNRHIWEFVPFFGGPRICPALQQVYTQFSYFMVRLTQEFESIENRDPVWEYVTSFKMTFESRNGVKIGLIPPTER